MLSPATTGPYAGLSIFADRNNTISCSSTADAITAGGSSAISGTIYAKSACLTLTGGGGTVGSRVIAADVVYTGGGSITIDPAAGQNAYIPLALLTD